MRNAFLNCRRERFWVLILAVVLIVMILGVFVWQAQEQKKPPSFLLAWGSQGSGPGQLNAPFGVAVDSSGNVYVTDTYGPKSSNSRIVKFTSSGAYITQWGSTGSGPGQFNGPAGVAVDSAGNVYVADRWNSRVEKFTSNGTYITQWGSYGNGNGRFLNPVGVAIDSSGSVYVTDYVRVLKFTGSGEYAAQWGSISSGPGKLNGLWGAAVDSSGNVYVTDRVTGRVEKYTGDGKYITGWRSNGFGLGVAIDSSGNVYVVDSGNNRVVKFTSDGAYITQWGSRGPGQDQFYFPADVAVDSSGNVYVTDSGNNRVEKFGSVATIPMEQVVLIVGIVAGALVFIIIKPPKKLRKIISKRRQSEP